MDGVSLNNEHVVQSTSSENSYNEARCTRHTQIALHISEANAREAAIIASHGAALAVIKSNIVRRVSDAAVQIDIRTTSAIRGNNDAVAERAAATRRKLNRSVKQGLELLAATIVDNTVVAVTPRRRCSARVTVVDAASACRYKPLTSFVLIPTTAEWHLGIHMISPSLLKATQELSRKRHPPREKPAGRTARSDRNAADLVALTEAIAAARRTVAAVRPPAAVLLSTKRYHSTQEKSTLACAAEIHGRIRALPPTWRAGLEVDVEGGAFN